MRHTSNIRADILNSYTSGTKFASEIGELLQEYREAIEKEQGETERQRIRFHKVLKSKDNKYMSLDHETGKYFWSENIGDSACWIKEVQTLDQIKLFTEGLDNTDDATFVDIKFTAKLEEI